MKHPVAFGVGSTPQLISASDYNSPHSGKIQTAVEICWQTTGHQHELKKIQHHILSPSVLGKSNTFNSKKLKLHDSAVSLIPFYISYCTIMV